MADDPSNPTPPSTPNPQGGTPTPATPPAASSMAEDALKAAQEAIAGLTGGLGLDLTPAAAPAAADTGFEDAMKAAMEEEAAMNAAKKAPPPGATPMSLPSLTAGLSPVQQKAIDLLADVNLDVKIELGRTRMLVEDVLKLGEGAVVELDKLAGDPVDIFVNNRHVARGEVLVLNDSFCVRVSEILQQVSDPATMVAKPA
jgi:flagellar motor switch protein FliN